MEKEMAPDSISLAKAETSEMVRKEQNAARARLRKVVAILWRNIKAWDEKNEEVGDMLAEFKKKQKSGPFHIDVRLGSKVLELKW